MHIPRRTFVGSTFAGLAAITTAQAAEKTTESGPGTLRGGVEDGKVVLPPLHRDTDAEGQVPNPDVPGKRLGIAVVGLGHLALEQIIPGFGDSRHVKLAALVSGDRDKARMVAAQYGLTDRAIYDYANFQTMRDNPEIDIVYIVLPNAMHAEFTARAADAGKHVLCEKPMATSVADAERMISACRAANRKLMIAYRCQYQPQHRDIIHAARHKEFGAVRLIDAVNGQNDRADSQWRQHKAMAGGGSLPDVGLYCLNAARYITGEEPVEITAQITQPKDDPRFAEVEDIAAFTLRFPSGVIANLASGYSLHESRHLRVQAEQAWFGLDPAFSYDNLTLEVGQKIGGSNGVQRRTYPPRNQFAREMDHFAQAIRADRQPLTPGEEGLQDMKLMQAIYQAAAGGSAVKLPEVKGLDTTRGPATDL